MTPPKLTRDTPVLDIFKPVTVSVLILGGIELEFVVHDGGQSEVSKVLHLEEPLHREFRFDSNTSTFGTTYLVGVGFYLLHESCFLKVLLNLSAHVETVHAYVHACGFRERAVVVENVDRGEIILLTEHVVINIVSGSHLKATSTKLDIYIFIFNNRDATTNDGHNDVLAFEPFILGVIRIDTHGRIAHDGFGASSCNYCITTFSITFYLIAEVIKFRIFFLIHNFLVRECGLSSGVPVYHAHTTINQSLIVEVNKNLDNAFRALIVHGESGAIPVARRTYTAQLLKDDTTMFFGPFPSVLQEFFTGKVGLLNTAFSKSIYYLCFGCYRSVVGTRHPTSILTFHTRTAHENVLNGVVEHVPHVEHTSNIGWRNHHGVGLTTIGF